MPRRSTAADNDPFRTDHPSDKNKLTLPKKIAKTPETPVLLKRIVKTDLKQDEDAYCPYCGERFALLTEPLKNAIQAIKDKDREYEKKQNDEVEKQNEKSVYSLPTNLTIKRRVSSIDKDAFCKLHRLELNIKPEGRKKGYPREIDFDKLGKRVMRYKDELDLVIADKLPSDYRTLAEDSYREMGSNKARSTMGVMTRFEATLPGYYGPKGAAVILDVLTEHYLKSGYLAQHLVSPQMPLEFLQQVLVPEVGFRLIQSDMLNQKGVVENAREKAKQIMDQSREYGNYMFPVKDQDIESHDIESYPSTSILDSEEDSETEEIHSVGDTKDEQLYDSE
ncbi:RTC4-like domain-containing protein [Gilbertella persicaria]|uniref:RTC4-like domain-containing protein n=1 Tax=Gilbertella persicaria TaxID=101096 RepID=UPI00221F6613|nr:RTC4-like domain-containing protein [Gilbertella persicaria]KAI8095043.1 RTC4-like domain-containing protein [Gilbertella persicaria]